MNSEDATATAEASVSNGRPGLSGWPLFEEFMTEFDSEMVNGYNDDINTLLTFAGLFSAVLTAFTIESYRWLQPDSSSVTNQTLGHISMQLANSSLPPASLVSSFQAPASSVWINSLWFLSLVLSLAAALFGMLVKQWLREYLKWTTMSGLSENQVCLRQVRYEAFLRWRMPAIIASIPALLEVALIIFLVGMDILLWTLNGIVFGICTVAIAALILLAFITTVLPTFCPHCPYKSPAGWACFLMCQTVARLWHELGTRSSMFWRKKVLKQKTLPFYPDFEAFDFDWRERDFAFQTWEPTRNDTSDVSIYGRNGYNLNIPDDFYRTRNISGRVQVLSRALTWIATISQDPRLLHAVEKCPPAGIHADLSPWSPFSRLVLYFHITCQLMEIDSRQLVPPEGECGEVTHGMPVIQISQGYRPHTLSMHYRLLCCNPCDIWESCRVDAVGLCSSMMMHMAHMIASNLLAFLDDRDYHQDVLVQYGRRADYYLQSSSILGAFLASVAVCLEDRQSIAVRCFAALLDRLLHIDTIPSRFFPLCLPLFHFMQCCESRLGRRLILCSYGDFRFTHLVVHKLPQDGPSNWRKDDCRLLAHIYGAALAEWTGQCDFTHITKMEEELPTLLRRMTICAERSITLKLKNCGWAEHSFNWPTSLRCLFDPDHPEFVGPHNASKLFPYDLVDALARCRGAKLINKENNLHSIAILVRRSRQLRGLDDLLAEKHGDGGGQLVCLPAQDNIDLDPNLNSQVTLQAVAQLVAEMQEHTASIESTLKPTDHSPRIRSSNALFTTDSVDASGSLPATLFPHTASLDIPLSDTGQPVDLPQLDDTATSTDNLKPVLYVV